MIIKIQGTRLELTASIKKFVGERLVSVDKLITNLDKSGGAQINVQIERTTRHHKHGNVLRAEMHLRLPTRTIRSEAIDDDIRIAIRNAADELIAEIKKFKGKSFAKRRIARKQKADRIA